MQPSTIHPSSDPRHNVHPECYSRMSSQPCNNTIHSSSGQRRNVHPECYSRMSSHPCNPRLFIPRPAQDITCIQNVTAECRVIRVTLLFIPRPTHDITCIQNVTAECRVIRVIQDYSSLVRPKTAYCRPIDFDCLQVQTQQKTLRMSCWADM